MENWIEFSRPGIAFSCMVLSQWLDGTEPTYPTYAVIWDVAPCVTVYKHTKVSEEPDSSIFKAEVPTKSWKARTFTAKISNLTTPWNSSTTMFYPLGIH
jgi:hypothetical protein